MYAYKTYVSSTPSPANHFLQARNKTNATTMAVMVTASIQIITIAATAPPDKPPLPVGGELPPIDGTTDETTDVSDETIACRKEKK